MSVALMSLAFKSSASPTQKLVLLALCDCANDQGECYPAVPTLQSKCSLSERAVQSAIAELEACGYLRREFRTGKSTVYLMTPGLGNPRSRCTPAADAPPQDVHPTPARRAPPPPQELHHTPAAGAPRNINEPSIESSKKHKTSALAGVDDQVLADWTALRKAKRSPVTQTAIAGIGREAAKAGLTLQQAMAMCCERGWAGFKAEWLADARSGQRIDAEPAWRTEQRERAEAFYGTAAAKRHGTRKEVVDVDAKILG